MSRVINYSLYEFRNVQRQRIFKQNRIILISSRLIEFWCFGLSVALGVGGWVDGGGGWLGGAPYTCAHARACTHARTRTCMCGKHDNSMQMAVPIGFGEIPGIPYDVIHACACVHMHACACAHVGGVHPVTTHQPPSTQPLNPPRGVTPGISQNSIALELIEIFQFCLKI